ncbi:MAG TPA: ribosome biogenesis GTPase Der [Gemmata sp.]
MALPIVAIVGRPNVGKSSLFNWLAGRRISIVDPTAGVTRDRVSSVIEQAGRSWELMDTGGIGIVDVDDLSADVERQIQIAIESAAVVVFVVDVREGVVPLDEDVAARLRTIHKPVVLVANKADTEKLSDLAGEFNRLGYGEPLCVSADQKLGKDELFEAVGAALPPDTGERAPEEPALMLAIVGRRNAGKSTFINSLAGGERVIVSEIPGTTRDSVDVRIERDGKSYVAIDTAGVRKAAKMGTNIEFYSNHRAQRSIRRADVVLHFMDARHRVSRVDKQLAEYIVEENKPAIFVVNKWDLVKEDMDTDEMAEYTRKMFPMLDHVPIAFITAKEGKNVLRVLQLAVQLHKQAGVRVTTGDLNRVVRAALEAAPPPMAGSKTPKVFYATQIGVNPPTIVLFTNGPELFDPTYVRYLTKTLRDSFPFPEVAIKVVLRAKGEGIRRAAEDESVEEVSEADEEVPVVRAPRRAPVPEPAEVPEEEAPRPKKKPRGSETWDF